MKLPAGSAASAIAMISAARDEVGLDGVRDLLVLYRLRIPRDRAELRFMPMRMTGTTASSSISTPS